MLIAYVGMAWAITFTSTSRLAQNRLLPNHPFILLPMQSLMGINTFLLDLPTLMGRHNFLSYDRTLRMSGVKRTLSF